ncbi:MAG: conjugal transfer protein TraL [Desulfovibrio sp.]|jgi:hypothetical protein|nr:conjugal transfer protein TraL [Desulfovibrio sp.]
MITTHWITQGKGGVGKSLIASLLAQYIREGFITRGMAGKADELVYCFDTDPVNATLAGYEALNVNSIHITDEQGIQVDERRFDELIEKLIALPDGSHAIIDNGASSFLSLCNYLKTSNVFELLQANGCRVLLHTVVTGGQAILDTLKGLKSLVLNFAGQSIVVWQNTYFGPVVLNGVEIEQMRIWQDHINSIEALITIPWVNQQTTGVDLRELFSRRRTFGEVANDPECNLMARHRLAMFWRAMKLELDNHLVLFDF